MCPQLAVLLKVYCSVYDPLDNCVESYQKDLKSEFGRDIFFSVGMYNHVMNVVLYKLKSNYAKLQDSIAMHETMRAHNL